MTSDHNVVGFVLFSYIYSTWLGKSIWMEDLFVKPDFRSMGIGLSLWKRVAQVALQEDCCRIDFYVLDWNQKSIDFYKSKGALDLTSSEGWHYFRLNRNHIENLSQ